MIITRENIKEEASNLNDEILNFMLELLKALKAERNDNCSKKHLYN